MIKKSLITCLVLLAAYEISLRVLPDNLRFDPTGGHYNVLNAEGYLYSADHRAKVLVGTSLAQMLGPLGGGHYNLAFGAGNPQMGLELLCRSQAAPPVVAIEMNYFQKPLDQVFIDRLFVPVLSTLRRHLYMLREKYRPANYVAGITSALIESTKDCLRGPSRASASKEDPGTTHPERPISRDLLEAARRDFDRLPDVAEIEAAVSRLKQQIKTLEARGCTCVLFEMPIDATLANSRLAVALRTTAHQHFPSTRYHWLPADDQHQYQTRDGTHLILSSATEYASYLKQQLSRFPRPNPGSTHRRDNRVCPFASLPDRRSANVFAAWRPMAGMGSAARPSTVFGFTCGPTRQAW